MTNGHSTTAVEESSTLRPLGARHARGKGCTITAASGAPAGLTLPPALGLKSLLASEKGTNGTAGAGKALMPTAAKTSRTGNTATVNGGPEAREARPLPDA